MNAPKVRYKQRKSEQTNQAFTILELVAVVSVLGILASIAIPTIGNFIEQSRLDGVKAKVNSVAADCLQKLRNSDGDDVAVDSNIISNESLQKEGYKISPNGSNCSFFSVEPTDSKNSFLFPMSFGIARGKLTKFAVPRGKNSLLACKAWAGVNCKESEELKELIAYNQSITAAKQKCEDQFSQWINAKSSGSTNRWNPTADSTCTSVPPKQVSPTCTPNGCNRKVYALDGVIVGYTQDDYDKALEEKYGRICTEKVAKLRNQSPPFTNPTDNAYTITECGPQEFWFHKGKEAATEEEWRGLMCGDEINRIIKTGTPFSGKISYCGDSKIYICNGEQLTNQQTYQSCLNANEAQACQLEINQMVATKSNGVYTHSANGRTQTPCGDTFWICNNNYKDSKEKYEQTCPATPPNNPRQFPVNPILCSLGKTQYCP